MKPLRAYYNPISFLDILFCTLGIFIMLFIIAFSQINPENKNEADIKTKAEFIITVTWDKDSSDDVDTWLQDPTEDVLFYKNKEMNLSHLDRDDIGHIKDEITLPNGETIVVNINQEMTTIRGFIPGEWILNVHMYKKRDKGLTTVTVQIDKLNPKVTTILFKEIIMIETWEEITITRFEMTSQGDIIDLDDLPRRLVKDDSPEEENYDVGDRGF